MVTLQSGRSYDGETVRLRDKDICELLYTVWTELLDFLTFSKIKRMGMMDVDETVDSMNASKMIIIPMGEKGGSVVISVKINLNLIKIDLL